MANASLQRRLRGARRRLWLIGLLGSVAWAAVAAILFLLAAAWLDLFWELSAAWRVASLWGAAIVGAGLIAALLRQIIRAAAQSRVARRMDQAAGSGGQILTGWELDQLAPAVARRVTAPSPAPVAVNSQQGDPPDFRVNENGTVPSDSRDHAQSPPWRGPDPLLTAGLAQVAVDRAAILARQFPLSRVAPLRPLRRPLAALAGVALGIALLVVCLPGLAYTQWSRFLDPWADVPPFSQTWFEITPGNTEVLYGDALDIYASVYGEAVDQLELVLEGAGEPQPPLPMFPEPDGRWRAVLAKVTEPAVYHARAGRARSERYQIAVITVPRIEGARLRIEPPDYTHQAAYEGPLPKDGVAGLAGTRVQIRVRSNRPLRGGTMVLTGQPGPAQRTMELAAPGSSEVVGQFEIAGDGKFECRVIDEAGQASQESFAGAVLVLADERPFIRVTQPEKESLATPTASLPVETWAEDDYGVSRVELYRSLNDSRPLPAGLSVPPPPVRRTSHQVYLPLAEYGVEPGDVIKLFGRVEDNDPAGAKGAESTVVTVRIISQEEFDRLLRAREGIEVLLGKYREAQRRMEGLADEMDGLRKKLKDLPPDSPVALETRQQLRQTLQRLQKESEALRKLAQHKLPFDLDQHLSGQLQPLVNMTEEMAKELDKLLQQMDLLPKDLAAKLDGMARRLAGQRHEFAQLAMEPLEHLETVFPLLVDQQRFTLLALQQKDLAERLAALKGRDGEDEPALKARMRDLEEEQQKIRLALGTLFDDIEDHVERLPSKPEFDELRQEATEFVKAVRASGAAQAMADAEAALAEFSGTRGHAKAQEAADILAKFVKQCDGVGTAGGLCLRFQPTLSTGMGNTLAQLLAGVGMGSGTGGYGLYGSVPGMFGSAFGQYGDGQGRSGRSTRRGASRDERGRSPDEDTLDERLVPGAATGIGEGAVPVRYRRQVGQYFQRINEELEGK